MMALRTLRQYQRRKALRNKIRTANASQGKVGESKLSRKVTKGANDAREKSGGAKLSSFKEGISTALYPRVWVVLGAAVALALIVGLASAILQPSSPSVLELGTQGVVDGLEVSYGQTASGDVPDNAEVSWHGSFSNDLPQGYDQEIGLSGDSPTAVSTDGRTIGFSMVGSPDEVLATIRADLEERGWTYVESGQSAACTFAKDEGVFCWLAVTCVAVDDETSVVLVPGKAQEVVGNG